jgi:hypothetical protein
MRYLMNVSVAVIPHDLPGTNLFGLLGPMAPAVVVGAALVLAGLMAALLRMRQATPPALVVVRARHGRRAA